MEAGLEVYIHGITKVTKVSRRMGAGMGLMGKRVMK